MFDEKLTSFRKLRVEDLPLMQTWLNQQYVHEFYDKDKQNTLEEITRRYGPKIRGEKPTDCYLVLYDEKPVAYIQDYIVTDWPEFNDYAGYDNHTASVDLFIGDQNFIGKGFGSVFLKKFLKDITFKRAGITVCIIGPESNNIRGIKSYEKVGFKYVKTVTVGGDPYPTYIMELKRNELI